MKKISISVLALLVAFSVGCGKSQKKKEEVKPDTKPDTATSVGVGYSLNTIINIDPAKKTVVISDQSIAQVTGPDPKDPKKSAPAPLDQVKDGDNPTINVKLEQVKTSGSSASGDFVSDGKVAIFKFATSDKNLLEVGEDQLYSGYMLTANPIHFKGGEVLTKPIAVPNPIFSLNSSGDVALPKYDDVEGAGLTIKVDKAGKVTLTGGSLFRSTEPAPKEASWHLGDAVCVLQLKALKEISVMGPALTLAVESDSKWKLSPSDSEMKDFQKFIDAGVTSATGQTICTAGYEGPYDKTAKLQVWIRTIVTIPGGVKIVK
ncbi:MAG: hypothetical protein V1495_09235 [Pseudomonadota bacterium]